MVLVRRIGQRWRATRAPTRDQKQGRSQQGSAFFASPCFLAESDKLTGRSNSVCAIGRDLSHRGAVEMLAVLSPGMVRSRRLGELDSAVDVFSVNDFGLAGEFLESGVGKGFVFVEDGDNSFGILANGDLGLAQGIIWTVGLDLVNDLIKLDGQVFGENTGFLAGEDQVKVFSVEQRAVGIVIAARGNGKAAVEIFTKLRSKGIGGFNAGDVS